MIDKTNSLPLYHQIKQDIIEKIDNKVFSVGELLPSEPYLMAEYNVSRMTIRLAMDALEKSGYIIKIQGKGTFVRAKKVTQELSTITSWAETMNKTGKEHYSECLAKKEIIATPELAEKMSIQPETKLLLVERLRYVENEPTCISKVYVVKEKAPDLLSNEGLEKSIYEILEKKYNIEMAEATETIEAHTANTAEAHLLHIKRGDPLVDVTRVTFDSFGNTIELSQASNRADKYAYTLKLHGRNKHEIM